MLQATARESLANRTRVQPGWFAANTTEMRQRIDARNAAHHAYCTHPSDSTRASLTSARSKQQSTERHCKSQWIIEQCALVNDGIGGTGGKAAWDTIKTLRKGLKPTRRAAPVKMQKPDGSRAETAEESATVFGDHFGALYGRTPSFDESVLESVAQRPTAQGLDGPPSDDEIRRALSKLHNTAPGNSGVGAALWKALGSTEETFALLRGIVLHFWETEEVPAEWEAGLLAILPKKGDLSKAGNYRGIIMLEVCYKLNGIIIMARLKPVKDRPAELGRRSSDAPARKNP